jgi:hypothetical protein
LRTVGEDRTRDEGMCGYSLQAEFSGALAADPHHPELSFLVSHPYVENFARPNLSPYALDYQPARAHIRYQGRMRKRLAMCIHSPDLHRELNFDSRTLSSIHRQGHCA